MLVIKHIGRCRCIFLDVVEEQIDEMIRNREHFGIYNNKAEANWVDKQIHEDFKKLYEK